MCDVCVASRAYRGHPFAVSRFANPPRPQQRNKTLGVEVSSRSSFAGPRSKLVEFAESNSPLAATGSRPLPGHVVATHTSHLRETIESLRGVCDEAISNSNADLFFRNSFNSPNPCLDHKNKGGRRDRSTAPLPRPLATMLGTVCASEKMR